MDKLIQEICDCKVCEAELEFGPRPIISVHPKSKIIIIGQAPGSVVHRTGIPWDDKSGDNLRYWLGVTKEQFYNAELFGIIPMGFCYPGKGKSGDLPPRKECAPLWHDRLLASMKHIELTLLIGKYAQDYYLNNTRKKNLTTTVKEFESYLPDYLVLPHPSPRNNIWMAKNPWFKETVLPTLRSITAQIVKEK